MMEERHIAVRGLRVGYGQHDVLHGIDLDVGKGEFVSIVGGSGCGKSTLLYALARFIPYRGEVSMPESFGIVFQNYAVFPWLTVKDNIAFGLHGIHARHSDQISKLLEMLGLLSESSSYPAQLSGGQTQRVALGRAIAADPEVIFMDEPFGALDLFTREKMQTWLLDIWEKQQKTVLFVTHSIEEAIFLSDRVIVLGRGIILGQFNVPFGRPRREELKFSNAFVELEKVITSSMKGAESAAGPLAPGK